jgi:hypothetical protein
LRGAACGRTFLKKKSSIGYFVVFRTRRIKKSPNTIMTSQESLEGSCSPPPNPPAPLASIQQEMKPNSSDSSIEQQHQHHAVVMEGSVTPPTLLPSITKIPLYVCTFTPSSTSSAKGAGSSRSAATATTATNGTTTITYTDNGNNQRRELSFDERIQVIQARSAGKSLIQLTIQFECGKTQILNILGQREAYLKEWKNWKQAELSSNLHIGK